MPPVEFVELAADLGVERPAFKLNVRKLKGLGLTESLGTGYRLSPRGEALLDPLAVRDLSPLWEMYKDGVDLSTIQWAAH